MILMGEFTTMARRDVVATPLSELCQPQGETYRPDRGYVVFEDGSGIMRLEDLPTGLTTLGAIERHLWKWVNNITFTDYSPYRSRSRSRAQKDRSRSRAK